MRQHLKPRSTTIVIYQGDDMDQLAHLHRKVRIAERNAQQAEDKAKQASAARRGDDDTTVTEARVQLAEAQAEYDAAVDEAAERALEVEIHSLGRRRFRDLLTEHPPRMVDSEPDDEGKTRQVEHADDAPWGVNVETYPTALLCYRDGDVMTLARPEFPSTAEAKAFVEEELAEGDFDQMWAAAHLLNRSPSADPFFLRSTTASPSTDAM